LVTGWLGDIHFKELAVRRVNGEIYRFKMQTVSARRGKALLERRPLLFSQVRV
jgi:hypothetical protein